MHILNKPLKCLAKCDKKNFYITKFSQITCFLLVTINSHRGVTHDRALNKVGLPKLCRYKFIISFIDELVMICKRTTALLNNNSDNDTQGSGIVFQLLALSPHGKKVREGLVNQGCLSVGSSSQ